MSDDYLEHNREHWDAMVDAHWESDFYDVPGWLAGKDSLGPIELSMLPDSLDGKRLLHLQCHFGQDTLSLARRGAMVTGVDLSARAIDRANELAALAKLEGTFVHSDVYGLPGALDAAGAFDLVFTSWGTIGWLPDLQKWSKVVDHFLAPGGALVLAEFHPMVWMYGDDRSKFEHSYFNRGPITESSDTSYSGNAKPKTTNLGWNHPFGEVLGALIDRGFILEAFEEYDYTEISCFSDCVEVAPGRYQLKGLEGILPLAYALRARKPGEDTSA
ncbi:Magnesium-protoporphyrin O-methyltransferase [Enhygromyxa salina]|uniref:Magnesium-protoporphyrin O-methyltransferase n=1 Tax=Enhygromyxa salina TaxID=215803 RepID=A0A2S9YBH2_9BACT|nr:class I SAM-dependent methyltransferase [Enhygromyxa salina]PRQ02449.1 Magnesium-protoporphyrin O-methyltransferase [Enhygromyxa salina]